MGAGSARGSGIRRGRLPVLERWIPDRQRVHRHFDLCAQMLGGLPFAVPSAASWNLRIGST